MKKLNLSKSFKLLFKAFCKQTKLSKEEAAIRLIEYGLLYVQQGSHINEAVNIITAAAQKIKNDVNPNVNVAIDPK
jgi:hypothetical protein